MPLVDAKAFLPDAVGVAEPLARRGARGIRGEPVSAQLVLPHREMKRELVFDIALE